MSEGVGHIHSAIEEGLRDDKLDYQEMKAVKQKIDAAAESKESNKPIAEKLWALGVRVFREQKERAGTESKTVDTTFTNFLISYKKKKAIPAANIEAAQSLMAAPEVALLNDLNTAKRLFDERFQEGSSFSFSVGQEGARSVYLRDAIPKNLQKPGVTFSFSGPRNEDGKVGYNAGDWYYLNKGEATQRRAKIFSGGEIQIEDIQIQEDSMRHESGGSPPKSEPPEAAPGHIPAEVGAPHQSLPETDPLPKERKGNESISGILGISQAEISEKIEQNSNYLVEQAKENPQLREAIFKATWEGEKVRLTIDDTFEAKPILAMVSWLQELGYNQQEINEKLPQMVTCFVLGESFMKANVINAERATVNQNRAQYKQFLEQHFSDENLPNTLDPQKIATTLLPLFEAGLSPEAVGKLIQMHNLVGHPHSDDAERHIAYSENPEFEIKAFEQVVQLAMEQAYREQNPSDDMEYEYHVEYLRTPGGGGLFGSDGVDSFRNPKSVLAKYATEREIQPLWWTAQMDSEDATKQNVVDARASANERYLPLLHFDRMGQNIDGGFLTDIVNTSVLSEKGKTEEAETSNDLLSLSGKEWRQGRTGKYIILSETKPDGGWRPDLFIPNGKNVVVYRPRQDKNTWKEYSNQESALVAAEQDLYAHIDTSADYFSTLSQIAEKTGAFPSAVKVDHLPDGREALVLDYSLDQIIALSASGITKDKKERPIIAQLENPEDFPFKLTESNTTVNKTHFAVHLTGGLLSGRVDKVGEPIELTKKEYLAQGHSEEEYYKALDAQHISGLANSKDAAFMATTSGLIVGLFADWHQGYGALNGDLVRKNGLGELNRHTVAVETTSPLYEQPNMLQQAAIAFLGDRLGIPEKNRLDSFDGVSRPHREGEELGDGERIVEIGGVEYVKVLEAHDDKLSDAVRARMGLPSREETQGQHLALLRALETGSMIAAR